MRRVAARLAAVLLAVAGLALAAATATAEEAGEAAGDFDFYVLSLSWSPSYCEAEGDDAEPMQCAGPRPFAFVLHGLWPQYERGYPSFCDRDPDKAPGPGVVRAMLDIMPSPGLVRHQWRKHGSCSGLGAKDYFDKARKAHDAVRIPPAFAAIDRYVTVEPKAVEAAFLAANPGLRASGVAVTCEGRRLQEVRVCLTRDLTFRACQEVDQRACRRDRVVMPPVR